MLKTTRLLALFARLFPKKLAKKYHDYVGLMIGRLPKQINRVYLALDLDPIDLEDVLAFKPDLVLTHHPFIYGTRYQVLKRDPMKRAFVKALDKAKIPVYSLHTNFDEGSGGMNDALATALGLQEIHPIPGSPMGRGGTLPKPLPVFQFAVEAKKKLGAQYGLLVDAGKKEVQKIALVGGGGSRDVNSAITGGYDLFISGDFPHHIRRFVLNSHFNYLDLPHEIEEIFIPTMTTLLLNLDPILTIHHAPKQAQAKVI